MTKPNVRAYMEELEAELDVASGLSDDQIKAGLLQLATSSDENGGTKARAWELLGKTKGMFKDVTRDETEAMSTSDLLAAIGSILGEDVADIAAQRLGLTEPDDPLDAQGPTSVKDVN